MLVAGDRVTSLITAFLRFSNSVPGILIKILASVEVLGRNPKLSLLFSTVKAIVEQQIIVSMNVMTISIPVFNDIFGRCPLFQMAYMYWIIPLCFRYSSGLLIRLYYTQKNIDSH